MMQQQRTNLMCGKRTRWVNDDVSMKLESHAGLMSALWCKLMKGGDVDKVSEKTKSHKRTILQWCCCMRIASTMACGCRLMYIVEKMNLSPSPYLVARLPFPALYFFSFYSIETPVGSLVFELSLGICGNQRERKGAPPPLVLWFFLSLCQNWFCLSHQISPSSTIMTLQSCKQ